MEAISISVFPFLVQLTDEENISVIEYLSI